MLTIRRKRFRFTASQCPYYKDVQPAKLWSPLVKSPLLFFRNALIVQSGAQSRALEGMGLCGHLHWQDRKSNNAVSALSPVHTSAAEAGQPETQMFVCGQGCLDFSQGESSDREDGSAVLVLLPPLPAMAHLASLDPQRGAQEKSRLWAVTSVRGVCSRQ